MAYKYITENNLYDIQNYMYSEYEGMGFIREYLDSRRNYLECQREIGCTQVGEEESNVVRDELRCTLKQLKSSKWTEEGIRSINIYTKRFEVRKRIYTGYGENRKPLADAGFEDYESYLLFADCLLSAYQKKKSLKYFSCLLKVDDTLLSIKDKLGGKGRGYLKEIIRQELDIFYQIAEENGIKGEMAE